MNAGCRSWFRLVFSLQALFIGLTVLCCGMGCWVGYSLNWIRQRHALMSEGAAVEKLIGNYICGATSDELPPLGSSIAQRLLANLGERSVDQVVVFYIVDDQSEWVRTDEGSEVLRATEDVPKVRRARKLFPEAQIVAVFFERRSVEPEDGSDHYVAGMISE